MIPAFFKGADSIQDLSAQYAAELLDLKPDLKVLDACAAPGGKTAHILETMPLLQELVAIDSIEKRLGMIKDNFNNYVEDSWYVMLRRGIVSKSISQCWIIFY